MQAAPFPWHNELSGLEGLESGMGSGSSWGEWKLHWSHPHPSGYFGNLWGSKLCPGILGVMQFCRLGLRTSGRKRGPHPPGRPRGPKKLPRFAQCLQNPQAH